MNEVRELELIELGEVSVETKGASSTLYFENVFPNGCIQKRPFGPSKC